MTDLSFHQADPGIEVSVKPGMAHWAEKGPRPLPDRGSRQRLVLRRDDGRPDLGECAA
jgi:hypothetical protein